MPDLTESEFNTILKSFRPLFAHKAVRNQGDGIYAINGKFGTIYPYSLDGEILGLNYARGKGLGNLKITYLKKALKPYILTFTKLNGEYEATFPIQYLEEVAEIIKVRKRMKQAGGKPFIAQGKHQEG